MPANNDTIVALSSASAPGVRNIVRLSGPGAFDFLDGLFFPHDPDRFDPREKYQCLCGRLTLPQSPARFDVTCYRMPAPASYTRENVVELHLPGAPALVQKVLELLLDRGARLAEPGEFTRRAVASGRIDLVQAEAVMKIIRATDNTRRRMAMSELSGRLSVEVAHIRALLLELLVGVQGNIDFVEEEQAFEDVAGLRRSLQQAVTDLQRIAGSREQTTRGQVAACVLAGLPNAGKSQLFNAIVADACSVVTDIPGTTRDYVEGRIESNGLAVRVFDTAGQSHGRDEITAAGQLHMHHLVEGADLVVFVLDGSVPINKDLLELAGKLQQRPTIGVVNKSDLPQQIDLQQIPMGLGKPPLCRVSALTGDGVPELVSRITRELAAVPAGVGGPELNLRQSQLVKKALGGLIKTEGLLDDGAYELMAIELQEASDYLSHLSEPIGADEVLDRIFAEFCIGK